MLQNWVGNGIGWGSSPLTKYKSIYVNLVIFWKQDGKSSSILKYKMIKHEREFFLKPWKVIPDKRREIKLDKLEKEEGRIIWPNKNTKYSRERKTIKL